MVESENKGSLMALVDNTPERVRVSSHPENECKAELAQLRLSQVSFQFTR